MMANGVSVPNGAWVLVADFSKAILLKNNGTPVAPHFEVKWVREASANPLTHDQGSDRPGKVFAGSHHSAVEETDLHDQKARRFIEHTATEMEKVQAAHDIGSFVLVAPPRALATLRATICEAVRASVVGELDRDLTHMPIAQIEEHLAT
jgi:protein required for attachment to host cells